MQTPAFSALVPMLPVTDVPRTIAFYERLGFTVGNTHTPDGEAAPVWAWLHSGSSHLMVNRSAGPIDVAHGSVALWLYCRDVEAMHAHLTAQGLDVTEISHPFYNPGGEFHVHDPDDYAVFVALAES